MTIDFEDEYATLRQEMLERFERIHDTIKYGVGAFIAFLSYYYTTRSDFDKFMAFTILQLLVALIGMTALRLYHSIYVLGTYIAVVIECGSEAKWHRMSRQLDQYEKKHKKYPWKHRLPFPFGERWGGDSAQGAILLMVLLLVGSVAIFSKAGCFSELLPNCAPQWIFFIMSLFILAGNIAVFYYMWWGMRKFAANSTETWKEYHNLFGKDFKDGYADYKS